MHTHKGLWEDAVQVSLGFMYHHNHHNHPNGLVISTTLVLLRGSYKNQEVATTDTPAVGWLPIETWEETPVHRGQGVEDN